MADQISMGDWIQSEAQAMSERASRILAAASSFAPKTPLALIERAKSDPDRVKLLRMEGEPDRYQIAFTKSERQEILDKYIELRRPFWKGPSGELEDSAESFTALLVIVAEGILWSDAAMPDEQQKRRKKFDQLKGAFLRVSELIEELDSAALGFFVAKIEEAEGRPALLNDPVMAMTTAGEMKPNVIRTLSMLQEVAATVAKDLPAYDRDQNHPNMKAAMLLDRYFSEYSLEFTASEAGFAALCLRKAIGLATGEEPERVEYWLSKSLAHQDSMAAFRARHKNA